LKTIYNKRRKHEKIFEIANEIIKKYGEIQALTIDWCFERKMRYRNDLKKKLEILVTIVK
jgi:hypothetical protein